MNIATNAQEFARTLVPRPGRTKLDIMELHVQALKDVLKQAGRDLFWLAHTDCGLTCSGCGTLLLTERDFAGHFTISTAGQYTGLLNLGECPQVHAQKASAE